MHLYENGNRSAIYRWNSVYVELDGMLQHGNVIGLEEVAGGSKRLIVDFGYPDQRSVSIEYGKILDCSDKMKADATWTSSSNQLSGLLTGADDSASVEVLIRDRPSHPWKRYPSKLLLHQHCMEDLTNDAVVEVRLANHIIHELLPRKQMRLPLSKEARRLRVLQPGHFVLRSCQFGEGFWTTLEPEIAARVHREIDDTRIVSVVGETMVYLQRHADKPLEEENLSKMFTLLLDNIRNSIKRETRYKSPIVMKQAETASNDELSLNLPVELLKEVFLILDTIERQRCRRICPLWNEVITSPELCRDVHVHLYPKQTNIFPNSHYGAFASIFKHFTSMTRTVFVRDAVIFGIDSKGREIQSSAGAAITCIRHLLETTGTRLDLVVLIDSNTSVFGRHWNLGDYFNNLAQAYTGMAVRGARIIWRNCSLSYCEERYSIVFRIPHAGFCLRTINATHIWNLFEEHLDYGKPLEADLTAQWIEEQITTNSTRNCVSVIQILDACQSCDPRPPAYLFNRKWTLDNLGSLQIGGLNRLCLYGLSNYILKWSGTYSANDRKL
ncbi:uncharacterized protein LOC129588775 [Paramacrobiotus metropolitanus]|uniref:uncharacterized protein LOC129588775 n=1 Tax=Paramacrobiotus metropolitanus TaxID=2943436 RepID=UPI002445E42F|nr:uncharacterized protein LOC129588775 [Paramacrobiotus metropolitanus]